MDKKLSISWFSNAPWFQTGYGVQTRLFVTRLQKAGYDMSITALAGLEGHWLTWEDGIKVFPRGYHLYGQDVLHSTALTVQADVVISLFDAWVAEPDMFAGTKWIPWYPVDSEPITQINVNKIKQAYDRLVFSKHACKMMDAVGMDYTYIPHGVDTNVYTPMDRKEAREVCQFPDDKFIVGMVAANKGFPSRKAFAENIAAFKMLHDKHPDTLLYLHTSDGTRMEGMNIPEYLKFIGLELDKDVILSGQFQNIIGHPDGYMNALYNAFDVHLLVSKGEGFGIPILEAQSAGCPVIVGDWTAMGELCFSGWKIPKSEAEPEYTQYGAYWFVPHIEAIYQRLENAYQKKDNMVYRERARAGALAYDADKITKEFWLPYLERLQERIASESIHKWTNIGLWNKDGSMSIPCADCNDELRGSVVIKDGFAPVFESGVTLDLVPDTDGVTKIVTREIKTDYDLDNLDLKPGDVVLDIGAHKGIVSCYLAKRYPGVAVLAYEPNEANYKALLENIQRNGIENVKPYLAAVTKDGRGVNVYARDDNSGGGVLQGAGNIPSVTLQQIFDEHKLERVALVKSDCEGSEFEIFENAGTVLDRIDHVRGEFHAGAGDIDALLKMVQQHVPDSHVTMLRQ